jgi:SpoVK/Ycf46/Vps4 family AAA+-type ATPase
MLAKACANQSGANFLSLHSAALESKWWGETPKLLQAAFRLARSSLSPCVIFFDEIDGMGRSRSEHDQSCVYSFKCELLRNMDGVGRDASSAVAVLACTNCPTSLDAALRRRFTRQIAVPVPTRDERADILRKVCGGERLTDEAVLALVADRTEGMTGADLASLYAEACSHRLWSAVGEDLSKFGDGAEFLRHVGPLTAADWTHSGRVTLPPRQNEGGSAPKRRRERAP